MPKPQPRLHPQRYVLGLGFVETEPHRASVWAAFIGNLLVGRYKTKKEGLEALRCAVKRRSPQPRDYQFGRRMPAKPAGVGTVVRISKEGSTSSE